MNGTGKSGIYLDPAGGFVAKANTMVRLSVRARSGAEVLRGVGYRGQSLSLERNSFTLTIQSGTNVLTLSVQRPVPEYIELLDSDGHILARFDSEIASFQIRGE
jgi:hypothetical protein